MTIESELNRIGNLLQLLIDQGSSKSESSTTKKTRSKASSSSPPSEETASSTSAAATTASPPSETAASAPAAEAASPATPANGTSPVSSAVPSLDQVRAALTQCQARNQGDIAIPRGILTKYAKTGTLGSLAEADRAKVIAECNAA